MTISVPLKSGCTVWYLNGGEKCIEASISIMSSYDFVKKILICNTSKKSFDKIGKYKNICPEKIVEVGFYFGEGWDKSLEDGGFDEVSARNFAIKIAESLGYEWLLQCDPDEFYTKDILKIMDLNESFDSVFFSCTHMVDDNRCIEYYNRLINIKGKNIHDPHLRLWRSGKGVSFKENKDPSVSCLINKSMHCNPEPWIGFPERTLVYDEICHIHLHDYIKEKRSFKEAKEKKITLEIPEIFRKLKK